jgi:hypothetical protein
MRVEHGRCEEFFNAGMWTATVTDNFEVDE